MKPVLPLSEPPECPACGRDTCAGECAARPSTRPAVRLWAHGEALPERLAVDLVDGMIPAGMTVLAGPSGGGKTFELAHLVVAVSGEGEIHGRATKHGTVVCFAAESPKTFKTRLEAAARAVGIEGPLPVLVVPDVLRLGTDADPEAVAAVVDTIKAETERRQWPPVVLVSFDTMARMLGGNENAADDLGRFLRDADELRVALASPNEPAAGIVVHHHGWGATRERGSSALRGYADAVLSLAPVRGDDGAKLARLSCEKMRDGDAFEPVLIELRQVVVTNELGAPLLNQYGRTVTTCVVVDRESDAPTFTPIQTQSDVVLEFVQDNPGLSARGIVAALAEKGVRKSRNTVDAVLKTAEATGLLVRRGSGWLAPVAPCGSRSQSEPESQCGSAGSLPTGRAREPLARPAEDEEAND